MKKRANMKFFNAQTDTEEAERHTTRSLRRCNHGDETVAVVVELEEARPTARDRRRRLRGVW
jgi:hypothetical protein